MAKTQVKIDIDTRSYVRGLRSFLKERMESVALHMEGVVKKKIKKSNQGGKKPSQPGEAPRVGLGTLRNRISGRVFVTNKAIIAAYGTFEGPALNYARRLELGFRGTDSKGRRYDMKPRPYLRPALIDNKKKIIRIITKG